MSGGAVAEVTVVLPTYRRPEFVVRAIDSVLRQTLSAWELVVVDDNEPGSSARAATEKLMARWSEDPRIRYVRHDRNRGGSAARNTGIRTSRAPFVAFLDDDDEWSSAKLERQVQALKDAGEVGAVAYCSVRRVDRRTGDVRVEHPDPTRRTLRDLLKRNTIGTTSAIVCRRSALLAVGGFDEALKARQDIDLYVRLASMNYDFVFVREPLVTWYRHEADSIGRDVEASVDAHLAFHAKHRALIERFDDVRFERLVTLGRLLVAAGRVDEARDKLRRAWRLRPLTWRPPAYLALTYPAWQPLVSLARWVRDTVGRKRRSRQARTGSSDGAS